MLLPLCFFCNSSGCHAPDKQTLPLAYNDNGKKKKARAFAEGVLFSTYFTTNILRNVDFTNPVWVLVMYM